MSVKPKQLASSLLTGGAGLHFEENVIDSFVTLMLTGGFAPCLGNWPIVKIKLQTASSGCATDDFAVFCKDPKSDRGIKLLCNAKHGVAFTNGDKRFGEVIHAAWKDFNNPKNFTKGRGGDAIALITGPLSAKDIDGVRPLLEKARAVEGPDEFFNIIQLDKTVSATSREKLEVFKFHLMAANGDAKISKTDLYNFLRHFHILGFDLDVKSGVNIALLNTIIASRTDGDAVSLWARVVDEVRSANQNGGTITLDSLSESVIEEFRRKPAMTVPKQYTIRSEDPVPIKWAKDPRAASLALACLVGEWTENSNGDREILDNLTRRDFNAWQNDIRSILQESPSPLQLKNGHWTVKDRNTLWVELSEWIFDEDLTAFQELAVEVLSENDSRVAADDVESESLWVNSPAARFSPSLRRGVANTVAFLGNRGDSLGKCTLHKPKTTALLIVRKVLDHAEAQRWGSLNHLLPILAEAHPEEFLNAVQHSLSATPNPFSTLFTNEGRGAFGRNHLTGVLWGLETLAWSDETIVGSAMLLAALAKIDPNGQWTNRPKNSLTTIFLPWMPQTLAAFEKQIIAIRTIQAEFPDVAWRLLLSLLPRTHAVSSGSHKPVWKDLTEEQRQPKISVPDYWKQVETYATMALKMAEADANYFCKFLGLLDALPERFQDEVSEFLRSERAVSLLTTDRFRIWTALVKMATRHRRFASAAWALADARVSKLEEAAQLLAPTSPRKLHERLFQEDEFELYDNNDDFSAQQEKLQDRRIKAILAIINDEGFDGIIALSRDAKSAYHVGYSLGRIRGSSRYDEIFGQFLPSSPNEPQGFITGYIMGRFNEEGWSWVDALNRADWAASANLFFLLNLPFEPNTWNRVETWLPGHANDYWEKVWGNPHQAKGDLTFAIDKFLEVGRPMRAIDCLCCNVFQKQELDVDRCLKALTAPVSLGEEGNSSSEHNITELIEALQNNGSVSEDDLARIEWAYLPLLGPYKNGRPTTLERKMSRDPAFFCQVLRLIYRSSKSDVVEGDTIEAEPDENAKRMTSNAWNLLHHWTRAPGVSDEGSFSEHSFLTWLDSVKKECTETGHLEVAYNTIGSVLFFAPPDPNSNLWIVPSVAAALNAAEHSHMRNGFTCRAFNSRGCHAVDVTGAEDANIANVWKGKAEAAESAGFHQLAMTLRGFANSYEDDAERIRTTYLL